MHIKAGFLSGYPIRCSFCLETKEEGRCYDVDDVTIFDSYGSPAAHGPITVCEACRSEFGQADLELEAAEMERHPRADEEEPVRLVSEAAYTRLAALTPEHMTFPHRGVKG